MKQLTYAALSRSSRTAESGCDGFYCSSERLLMTDVSLHGDIGFVLVVHHQRDGLVVEKIYYALRNSDGTWQEPDHLSGGLAGIDPQVARDVQGELHGETMKSISDAESLIYTGRFSIDDGYESIRFLEVLTAPWTDHIEVVDRGRPDVSVTLKSAPHMLSILVTFPEERLLLRTGSDGSVIHFDGAGVVADDDPGKL
ncbi:hypothetical protein ACIO6T_34685 [Streptomyces sp. NPDC087532]|uniref:hypothetical protein n=1 Tax=Streptomyces sp. NPDC087532 TaxID=3365795 RepID=UPI00382BE490